MQRRRFEVWLRRRGAKLVRHGASHDVWERDGKQASLPRHGEIKSGTTRAICKQLRVPEPPGKQACGDSAQRRLTAGRRSPGLSLQVS